MYRNIKSLCWYQGLAECFRSTILQKKKKPHKKRCQICSYQMRGVEVRELDEGGQKVQIFSYKINTRDIKYNMINIINSAVWCIWEKAMATRSSVLAWKIPWTEEPGRLQSTGSHRVRYDWVTSFSLFTFMHWRRKWQPTPILLSGESQGWRSLVGCCLWGRTESNTTEAS